MSKNRESLVRSRGFWLIAASSSLRVTSGACSECCSVLVVGSESETGVDQLTCWVEGAMF